VSDIPDPTDVIVGAAIRLRRTQIKQSQSDLAEQIGVTFQQVQKYERGGNRVSASMLARIAKAQDKPIAFYFADVGEVRQDEGQDPAAARIKGYLKSPQAWTLAERLLALPPHHRRAVSALVTDLASVA
jgi:transcriptional regulator with XRE-family HTH domain